MAQVILVPPHKIAKLRRKLQFALTACTIKVKHLQSLAGSLNFYARAKPGGRPFICRIYDAQKGIHPLHHHVNVTSDMKKDIKMWLELLERTKVATPFLDIVEAPCEDIGFFSDVSEVGWGVYMAGHWAQGRWNHQLSEEFHLSMVWKELYALTIGVLLWAPYFAGHRVLLHTDNIPIKCMVNDQTTPVHTCMGMIRMLVLAQLEHNFVFKAEYIESKNNTVADNLSHFQMDSFWRMCPHAHNLPSLPPACLWPQSSTIWMRYST